MVHNTTRVWVTLVFVPFEPLDMKTTDELGELLGTYVGFRVVQYLGKSVG